MTRRADFIVDEDGQTVKKGFWTTKKICLVVVVVVVLMAILTPVIYFSVKPGEEDSGDESDVVILSRPSYSGQRVNCFPEAETGFVQITAAKCRERGCVFDSGAKDGEIKCFFTEDNFGYKAGKQTILPNGFQIELSQYGKPPFGGDIQKVQFTVTYYGDNLVRFTFDDVNANRYKVPVKLNLPQPKTSNKYQVDPVVGNNDHFAFSITRKDTGTKIWNTSLAGFTFTDQFLQISTILPSKNIYGFGENRHKSFRHDLTQTWPLFSRDQPPGWKDNANLYGVHPFYTCVEDANGNTHGVFLLNSNAQDYSFTDYPSLTYRTIGGILDFYVFMGPTPENVIQQYTELIGRPLMPPYWSLGFQLCRYGYNHIDNITQAVDNTKKYNIPHDVQYADIDHMDERMDFTIDNVNFNGLNEYFQSLRNGGMRTILILDPTLITNVSNYEPYEKIKAVNGNIKWPSDMNVSLEDMDVDGSILGFVWPKGKVVFPDFFKSATQNVWKELIKKHHKEQLVFDGLWIDMNEPANFGTNLDKPWNWPDEAIPYWSLKCPQSKWDNPPYRTKVGYLYDEAGQDGNISDKTICMISRQGESGEYRHYDVHSLYGWSQTPSTLQGLREATKKRGLVITRSTFPSSGTQSGHWLGDNNSQWSHLAESIIGILEFNLFGIPYIGADICGFFGETTPELCKRWMQLGAFYTFSRNHNGIGFKVQDPGSLGDDVAEASRIALETRYWLLPYLYTLFHKVHTNGGTVIRSLHHEFYSDMNTYGIDRQFLWGPALLISPILEQGQTSINYYLPNTTWYNFYNGAKMATSGIITEPVQADSKIPLHVRGSFILPLQTPANNTNYSRKNGFRIIAALKDGQASGDLFWDDGDTIDAYENGAYYMSKFTVNKKTMKMSIDHNDLPEIKDLYIETIDFWGVADNVKNMTIYFGNDEIYPQFNYNPTAKTLGVMNIKIPLSQTFHLTWQETTSQQFSRIDCYPERQGGYYKLTQSECQKRNCMYDGTSIHPDIPQCYFRQDNYGYTVFGALVPTSLGFNVPLRLIGVGPFPGGKTDIILSVEMRSNNLLRFMFDVPGENRYKVPIEINLPNQPPISPLYDFKITNNQTFAFQIIRKDTGTVIFDTSVGGLTFADQFLQISTRLPSKNIYGFGENLHHSFQHKLWYETWPMFSRDQFAVKAYGDNLNHYGVHPFYVSVENSGNAHGVLLLNSNAQDYSFTPLPMLTYRTIGGILDFYVFMGPTPENVIQQYTEVIGRPMMPAYWSLGFQLCRYGYDNIDNLKAAVERTKKADIPHDVQYADIDHYDDNKIFTIDNKNFGGLSHYFKQLRSEGMRTIIILDPCIISNETNYKPYDDIRQDNGAIKWPDNFTIPDASSDSSGALLGYVWPRGKVVFADYFKDKTKILWKKLIKDQSKQTYFDGLWIDMNEPANFGTNEDRPFNWPENVKPYWSLKCPNNNWDDPPYRTRAAYAFDYGYRSNRLSDKTICLVARQGESGEYRHYDVHSLYGWSQTPSTLQGLNEATGERGVVITRSTFVGSGKYAGHWLGDNKSTWEDMRLSIIGMLEFNLFGIPYVGADICGYSGDSTAELCKRWMQLGAFYPFSRNHNGKGAAKQDPAILGDDVARASREALRTRYQLLPYLYTLFHIAHVRGDTVVRALHHQYPKDTSTYNIDEQFLWGKSLLISPILYPEQTKLKMYLPQDVWYDFYTKEQMISKGSYYEENIEPESKIPLHIRGGSILILQDPARNTRQSRLNPMRLMVALDQNRRANGHLFWDDGVSIDTYEKDDYFSAKFEAKVGSLTMKIQHNAIKEINSLHIESIDILGITGSISTVRLLAENKDLQFTYNQTSQVLNINHKLLLNQDFQIILTPITSQHYSRIDCYPEVLGGVEQITSTSCESRGCMFDPVKIDNVPQCYYKTKNDGYLVNGNIEDTDLGYRIPLRRSSKPGPFQNDISNITFEVQELDNHLLRIKFYDPVQTRYEVPITLNLPESKASDPRYLVKYTNNGTFSFQIIRKSTGTVLWDTSVGGFIFDDQYLQLSTKLPSNHIYGFGENIKDTFRHDLWFKSFPMFSRDQWTFDYTPSNHYGVHPFYMAMENDGHSHGVLLLNSNAQEYSLTPLPMLTYRTIGGILDFYIFLGPEPENVVQQYTTMIGKPYMPPYWSLGFQLSRYGYNSLQTMQEAVDRTRNAGIPHDIQVADIDHMDERKDFTVDNINFNGLKQYFNSLRDDGMKTIIILDPALITNETNYSPYERMKTIDGNIKWPTGISIPTDSSDTDGSVLGYVWPKGKVVFPDFFKNSTQTLWSRLITEHYNVLPFDGMWIDMNEPANFGTNEERAFNWPEEDTPYWTLKCQKNKWDDPPYRTMAAFNFDKERMANSNVTGRLSDKTLCMNLVQGENGQYKHYDVHSLYGWSQTLPTLDGMRAAKNYQERGIVLSRSTFPGSGAWSVHWLGDNESSWKQMALSIVGILDFNIFGIPYVGADICGFFGNTTNELCKRWMQLGAFYTFNRNHNGENNMPQDPGYLGDDVVKASKEALETRYWLLPYLYTLFHKANLKGGTVIRPLHHEFSGDITTYGIDKQFLWGSALLISPILYQNQKSISYYLPTGRWYSFYTGEKATDNGKEYKNVKIAPDSKIPLHVRNGYILPLQKPANNTKYSRQNPFKLIVALEDIPGRGLKASGELFWDDGDSIDTYKVGNYLSVWFECFKNRLEINVQHDNLTGSDSLIIDTIEIFGIEKWINYVTVNGAEHRKFTNTQLYQKLKIRDLTVKLAQNSVIEWSPQRKGTQAEYDRVDCLPDAKKYSDIKTECTRRKCLWREANGVDGVPWCHIDNDHYGYNQVSQSIGPGITYHKLKWKNESQMFTGDISDITLSVEYIDNNILHFKIYDPNNARYEVPVPLNLQKTSPPNPNYVFETNNTNGFTFQVRRRLTNKIIWDTSIGGLTFAEQFLQLVTRLPSENVYGFGENRHFSLRHDLNYKTWPMFARDQAPGWGDYANLYGVHPFYLCIDDETGNSHGVLLLNSNAMEVAFQPAPALTYRTLGGVLDFYMFMGPTPESVIQQYTNVIGRPYLPPYWSLGFQLCRYGYNSLQKLQEAVDRTIEADIPFDVQYADIDHMDERMDFTVDDVNFNGLSTLARDLQSKGMRFIIILDPAIISNVSNYKPYELGLNKDIYIKWPVGMSPDYSTHNNDNILGYVWPKGKTVFPDFLNTNTSDYWRELIVEHYVNKLSFDGLWIDMNEPANFGTNEDRPFNWPEGAKPYWSLKCPNNNWDDPPYKPAAIYGNRLSEKTICMISLQNTGQYRHYDVHNLYGWSQTQPTLKALQAATGERGMVISRSTYPSSGKYTGHWLGDNESSWKHLYDSILGIIEFNLFGIPYIGADICGFFNDVTPELCERWMQLGAFYTYTRNHNGLDNKPQDPAALGPEVAASSRKALRIRYSLLPYLYTLFYKSHVQGGTVIRALFNEFPSDDKARSVETQFLWGSSFMIAPVYLPGQTRRDLYFPDAVWYDYYTGVDVETRSGMKNIVAPRDTIPLFIRGGIILPTQFPANTTFYSRLNALGLIIAPDERGQASGSLFWDDGISIDTVEKGHYFTADFTSTMNSVTLTVTKSHSIVDGLKFDRITVYNVAVKPTEVLVSAALTTAQINYNRLSKVLKITKLDIPVNSDFTISWR